MWVGEMQHSWACRSKAVLRLIWDYQWCRAGRTDGAAAGGLLAHDLPLR